MGHKAKEKKEKRVLTPEQKKLKTKKALIITSVVVLVLAIFFGSVAIANVTISDKLIAYSNTFEKADYTAHDQLVPEKDSDGYYTFTADRDLKIIQITDVHIGGGSFSATKDKWALNAVSTMIRAEQPDLVVVTGDIAYPVPFSAGTFNNLNATKAFAEMMESIQVYWTFTFGNHDTELYSMYSREDICKYYEESNFKYCLFERGFSDENDENGLDRGFGNTIIKVKNSQGLVTQAIVTIDSHTYIDGDYFGIAWKYDNIHQSQVDWYKQEMTKIKDANKAFAEANSITGYVDQYVNNIAFFHIPLVEYRDAWKQIKESNVELVPGATIGSDIKYYYGNVGEKDGKKNGIRTYGVFCGMGEDSFFETGLECNLKATFCGHDHYNAFSIEYKGIRLNYGRSIDFLAYATIYKEHEQRGCTVITVKSDGSFDCKINNYYEAYGATYEAE